MEVNAEPDVIKYSKLLEHDAKDKIDMEKLVLKGIANNNYPSNVKIEDFGVDLNLKIKGKQRKFGFKTLAGLFLTFLMIVTGLIAGLVIISMENQSLKLQNGNLTLDLELKHQFAEDLLHAQNMSQAQIENLISKLCLDCLWPF